MAKLNSKHTLFFLPFLFFMLIGLSFWYGLKRDRVTLPTALIGKTLPEFEIPNLLTEGKLNREQLKGKQDQILLVNFFASWCIPCHAEHASLMELSRDPRFKLYGIAYKDKLEEARSFLQKLGNPFSETGWDLSGRQAIEWGVSGVPETFIIAKDRVVERIAEPLVNPTAREKFRHILKLQGFRDSHLLLKDPDYVSSNL